MTSFSVSFRCHRQPHPARESAVKDYKKFLSGGCSKGAGRAVKYDMGVDMHTPAPVNDALSPFGELDRRAERAAGLKPCTEILGNDRLPPWQTVVFLIFLQKHKKVPKIFCK